MGVNGLWTVVQPCARPTNLATLNRKRLAVDASIWIYQFLKAVRDKEGNALRNSHVVGFFRRICKLLWFGILPVFVFDGGAPALKRATIQQRQRRREGRRDDAVKTAGKLLAVQMQRIAEEDREKRRREQERDASVREQEAQAEELPDMNNVVYAGELGMSQQEREKTRTFRKQDQYHLPDLHGDISNMGKPEDPRIMSVEELEEYARQFHNGEDINLYDFSKIDFDGDFFKSLPPADRYNILNAARLRSRLRMGLSKEQLDDMFPDRMAFSRFQIERVRERNNLTQRLMAEAGMTGTDLTLTGNARVAGEKDREYILVKNEGAEGGWALGVVSKEKDVGESHKPIDVDAIQVSYQSKDAGEEEEEDEDLFEDVPIEGVNRLPKPAFSTDNVREPSEDIVSRRQAFYASRRDPPAQRQDPFEDAEESLFVGGNAGLVMEETEPQQRVHPEEQDDIDRAIAMSLQNQHGGGREDQAELSEEEAGPEPQWTQKIAETARPIGGSGGSMIAHIVNNRASAAMSTAQPKTQSKPAASKPAASKPAAVAATEDSDSEEDMQAIIAKSRKKRQQQPEPVFENKKNPFDGPLPFPKLDWKSSLFSKSKDKESQKQGQTSTVEGEPQDDMAGGFDSGELNDDEAGGFEKPRDENEPAPLPPWMIDNETDIRENIQKQQEMDRGMNAEDKAQADELEAQRRRVMRNERIDIESSDDEDDVEILSKPPTPEDEPSPSQKELSPVEDEEDEQANTRVDSPEPLFEDVPAVQETESARAKTPTASPKSEDMEFEDVAAPETKNGETEELSPEPEFEDVPPAPEPEIVLQQDNVPSGLPTDAMADASVTAQENATAEDDDMFADIEYDQFSDPGDEELMAQMAEEAEEHARFASELNNKSAQQNKEDYERELRQLRNQQKKDRRDADEVTQVMVTECQALLRLFGIPYITAPMEAEAQCASLVKLGLVDGIVTDDSDTFLFGGTRVYKNMFNTNKFVECYLAADLEKELSLSREQLISLAQLLGSDYTEGLTGVGPVTAVEILSEFPGKSGLEDFREWWLSVQSQQRPKEADAGSTFRKKFRKSQGTKLFLPTGFPNPAVYDAYLNPEVDSSTEHFQWGVPDLEGLRQFLMATIGWSRERTDEVLVPVIKDMNKRDVEGTQANITRFFNGGVGAGAKEAFAPRHRAQGSKRMLAAVDKLRSNVAGEPSNRAGAGTTVPKRKRNARQTVDDDDEEVGQDGDAATDEPSKGRKKGKKSQKTS